MPAKLVDVMVDLDILQLVADGDWHVRPALVERSYSSGDVTSSVQRYLF